MMAKVVERANTKTKKKALAMHELSGKTDLILYEINTCFKSY